MLFQNYFSRDFLEGTCLAKCSNALLPVGKNNVVFSIFISVFFLESNTASAQILGNISGDNVEISSIVGGTGMNNVWNKNWLYRFQNGTDWTNVKLHDGIGIDGSFLTPRLNTRTWWERDPNHDIQSWGTGASTYFTINQGKLGIGTFLPKAKLDVVGGVMLQSTLTNASVRPLVATNHIPGEVRAYSATDYLADDGFLRLSAGAGSSSYTLSYIDLSAYSTVPDMNMNIVMGTNGMERMRIANSGNIGIGTANPAEKLSVNGKIRAHEIKVEITGWPDYVFLPSYKVHTLQETEKYIQEKGHLPGIPSAIEVEKNGLELGEMNKKLLQKIEELTLHLIIKDKQIMIINKLNESYEERLKRLEVLLENRN